MKKFLSPQAKTKIPINLINKLAAFLVLVIFDKEENALKFFQFIGNENKNISKPEFISSFK